MQVHSDELPPHVLFAHRGLLESLDHEHPEHEPGSHEERRPRSYIASTAAVATMAQECLGAQVLPFGLDRLLSRAEGVPLLVEELLAAAVESGGLTSDDDEWAVRPEAD